MANAENMLMQCVSGLFKKFAQDQEPLSYEQKVDIIEMRKNVIKLIQMFGKELNFPELNELIGEDTVSDLTETLQYSEINELTLQVAHLETSLQEVNEYAVELADRLEDTLHENEDLTHQVAELDTANTQLGEEVQDLKLLLKEAENVIEELEEQVENGGNTQ